MHTRVHAHTRRRVRRTRTGREPAAQGSSPGWGSHPGVDALLGLVLLNDVIKFNINQKILEVGMLLTRFILQERYYYL